MSVHQATAGKRAGFSDQQISRVFRALSDPTRRAVVAQLALKPASMTELARPFKMALPSFSQHLSVLEECGVVSSHKQGRVRHYQLVPQPLAAAEEWMVAQRAIWEQRLDQLADYVEKMKAEER